jgi:hypothetical protein
MANKVSALARLTPLLLIAFVTAVPAQTMQPVSAPLPDAPSMIQEQQQQSGTTGSTQSQTPGPDMKLPESSKVEQNSKSTPEQPKRILYVIPNYRAVSADANVPPLDVKGKFKLFFDDSFDYSTFLYVGALAGIAQANRNVPEFGDGADAYGRYYYHFFADQGVGNFFTEFALPSAFKEDPRYFTLGHGGFFHRTGYALSRLAVTRTDDGGSSFNFSEVIGNGAAAGISGLYYPSGYATWTKTGQRWADQLALDAVFNVLKEFWPDIRHSVLHQN